MSIERARQLRKQMPPAEARLWNYLRTLKAEGYHFRRQVQLGPYYADFACHSAKLVIEVDGETHHLPGAHDHDTAREHLIRNEGYQVIRYTNVDVLRNLDGVAEHLNGRLSMLPTTAAGFPPPPSIPPHKGEGGASVPLSTNAEPDHRVNL